MEYIAIIFAAVFVNNIVLTQFLGICPFLGVSSKKATAFGMGMAVMFVMTLATIVTWTVFNYILKPLDIMFMQTVMFILVIAGLVQMVEIILKKVAPPLYQALGIFLPLITTNCTILGVAILVVQKDFSLFQGVAYAIGNALGFLLAILVFAGIIEHLSLLVMPKVMKGAPIAFIVAGILSLAFMGFAGLGG